MKLAFLIAATLPIFLTTPIVGFGQEATQEELTLLAFDAQQVFQSRCSACHGGFETVPNKRFIKRMTFFYDLNYGGQRVKLPPRMAGIRLDEMETEIFGYWVLFGAPDWLTGIPTLTEEEAHSILSYR